MIWALKDRGVSRPRNLPDHIERRLRFALSRFAPRIDRVVVFLEDQNGPKGGIDKVCRVLVKVRGCGVIMAAVVDNDWMVAVDGAISRISRTVARQIERCRNRHAAPPRDPSRLTKPMRLG